MTDSLVELTLDQALKQGVEAHQAGQLQTANKLYVAILKEQPKHPDANHNMGILTSVGGNIQEALPFFKTALETKPSVAQFWLSYINALLKLDQVTDAKAVFNQAKKKGAKGDAFDQLEKRISKFYTHSQDPPSEQLQPIVDHYTGGLLKQALSETDQMLKKFPHSPALYNLAGAANMGLAQFSDAISSYQKAIKINPTDAEAYNNMGVAMTVTGDLDAAIGSYEETLKINPKNALAQSNLLDLLTSYTPKIKQPSTIATANEIIRNIDIKSTILNHVISDAQVVGLFTKAASHIISSDSDMTTKRSQTYRKSSVDLNCKRHMSIFKQHNIIPEFCFSCYKVQAEPKSIIDLIKLYLVFEQLNLNENNTRKCMVELRPTISGFYKGIIFCSGLEQANQIAAHLNTAIEQSIGSGLSAKVKRGCSEYPVAFPEYKEINNFGPQLMNYNEDWKVIEEDHDSKHRADLTDVRPSVSGLNLRDVLVIRRWIDYAKGIGDLSADLINQDPVRDQRIYSLAKARLDRFSI
jgi:tetratricopeptide (TPR) repeat protein|tara:strand:- start:3746 stop:5317 length:1572 start_codon:yes stop_codon:yes gene_type:complete